MHHCFISTFLIAILLLVGSPGLIKGQSTDSLLYLIDNDLVEDDEDKYDLLCQVITEVEDEESILLYGDLAIDLALKLDILPAQPYLKKGEAYLNFGKLALALDCFMKAANYYEEQNNSADLGRAYMSMAETYNRQGDRLNERIYLQNAIKIFEQDKDSISLGYALHNFAYFNYSKEQYDTALIVYSETLDLFKKLDDPNAEFAYYVCIGNIGLVYSAIADFDKAEEFLLTAIDTLTSRGFERSTTEFMIEMGVVLSQKGELEEAISYATLAYYNSDDPGYKRDASALLSRLYEGSDRFDSAYYYQAKFIVANDSIKDIERVRKMADLRTMYEVGKKQAEVDVLKKNKQINRIIMIGLGIILIMAIWQVTSYYRNLRRSRMLNRALEDRREMLVSQSTELKEKNEELTVLNEAISNQNAKILETNEELRVLNEAVNRQKNEMLDSITYAEKIQAAMLPPEQYFREILNDVFILFKPRDIVSGDFYWIKHVNQYVIIAAADCTGHGVPGAFMSLVGINFLDEVVQRREITQANQVLTELRKRVRKSLRQHGQADEAKDGIDMALCVIDEKNNTLQYSGANNPLYLIRAVDGVPELTEFKADRMPLGYYQGRFQPFTNKEIQLEYGDVFYMFSDGFVDQKGGPDNKKFMSKRFKDLLLRIHQESMPDQRNILEKTITEWMGDTAQIDDILVMGVRI